jgi:hypothetical protein
MTLSAFSALDPAMRFLWPHVFYGQHLEQEY